MGVINHGSLQDLTVCACMCRLQGRQTSIINNQSQEILGGWERCFSTRILYWYELESLESITHLRLVSVGDKSGSMDFFPRLAFFSPHM